jgi:hypothetical protein
MSKAARFLLAATLTGIPSVLLAQSQNPDQMQDENAKNKPSPKVNQPQNDTGQPQMGRSPDQQQQKNAAKDTKHSDKKSKGGARQAHGTPQPKGDTTAPQ